MDTNIQSIIEKLEKGQHVIHKVDANDMEPVILKNEPIVLEPVSSEKKLNKNNVVFCEVNGRFYVHFITASTTMQDKKWFQIGDLHGSIKGDVTFEKIYGKAIVFGETPCEEFMKKNAQN